MLTRDELAKRIADAVDKVVSITSFGKGIGWVDTGAGVSVWSDQAPAWKELLADAELGALLRKLPKRWSIVRIEPDLWGVYYWKYYTEAMTNEATTPEATLKMAMGETKDDSAT